MESTQINSTIELLLELETSQIETKQQLANLPDRMKPVAEIALASLGGQVQDVFNDESVQEAISSQSEQLEQDTAQINELVDKGLVPREQADTLLGEVVDNEDYELLRIVWRLGPSVGGSLAVSETIQATHAPVSEIEDTDTSTPLADEIIDALPKTPAEELVEASDVEPERIPAALKLFTMSDGSIEFKVGRNRGKRHKLGNRKSLEYKDYTKEREAFIKLLVGNQDSTFILKGEEVAGIQSTVIADHLDSQGLGVDRNSFYTVRSTLMNIKFLGKDLFEKVGGGANVGYRLNPEFEATLEETAVEARIKKTTQEVNKDRPAKKKLTIESSVQNDITPLRESSVLAAIIKDQKHLLEALNIPELDPNIALRLEQASLHEDQQQGIERSTTDARTILQERTETAQQFRAVLSQDDLFSNFLDNLDSSSPISDFMDYLSDLTPNQWDTLINGFLTATYTSPTMDTKNGKTVEIANIPTIGVFTIETDSKGNTTVEQLRIAPDFTVDESTADQPTNNSGEEASLASKNSKGTDEADQSIATTSAVAQFEGTQSAKLSKPITRTNSSNRRKPAEPERTKRTPVWEKEWKLTISEALKLLEEKELLFDGTLKASALGGKASELSTMIGTETSIRRLINAGIMDGLAKGENPNHRECDFTDLVFMWLFNKNKQLLDSGGDKRKHKRAISIVREAADSFIQKRFDT